MNTLIGLHFFHEQHSPSALLRDAHLAAEAGFTIGMCSDHLRPWSERQGHSGFAWSWLGSAMAATPMSFGTVCAPGQRDHPVIIAQAAATLAEMYSDRFWLAVGSGEALNEAITGDTWPSKDERNVRLKECVDVMSVRHWSDKALSSRPATETCVCSTATSSWIDQRGRSSAPPLCTIRDRAVRST